MIEPTGLDGKDKMAAATNHSEVQELRVLGAKKAALEGMVSQFTKTLLLLTENFYRSQEMSIKILRCGRSTVKYFSMLMDVFGHTSRPKIKQSYLSTACLLNEV